MKKPPQIWAALLLICGVLVGCHSATQTDEPAETDRPNIVILLVDDAGYADFGFMGSTDLSTPNLDQLAENGMIFTDAHVSASVCGPSRAGLITGRYQQRFGFECNPSPGFTGLDTTVQTIAERLQLAGYTTAHFGKWHLGNGPENWPNARGFDYSWGFLAGGRSYFPKSDNDQEGDPRAIQENGTFTTFEGYLTDVLGEQAAAFIDRQNGDQPFFMYWAPNAVHTPMEATEEDLARFTDHPRQQLAAMTWSLDRAVGTIVQKLKERQLLDNTLLFFLSDNGGAANNQSTNHPLKGFKGNKYEGGHRVAFFAHWPATIGGGQRFDQLTSSLDIAATAAELGGASTTALDGTSLLPYFTGKTRVPAPHETLFWRKDQMAAARSGSTKFIRVENLGTRLYDLATDLGETKDLSKSAPDQHRRMKALMAEWEAGLIEPIWTESAAWDSVTWLIHQDFFDNQAVRFINPEQWRKGRTAETPVSTN